MQIIDQDHAHRLQRMHSLLAESAAYISLCCCVDEVNNATIRVAKQPQYGFDR